MYGNLVGMNEWSVADRSIRVSVDAYPVPSIRVGASIQEQPNHLHMTIYSGKGEGSSSKL